METAPVQEKEGKRRHEKFIENTSDMVQSMIKKMSLAGLFQGAAIVLFYDGFTEGSTGKMAAGGLAQLFSLAIKIGAFSYAKNIDDSLNRL